MTGAGNDENTADQIGTELHTAYKLNASEVEYAYMSKQAAMAHGENSLEDVLKMCAQQRVDDRRSGIHSLDGQ